MDLRKKYSPEDLGFMDWYLFRRQSCPYRPQNRAWKRYQRAYEEAKRKYPNPGFRRIR